MKLWIMIADETRARVFSCTGPRDVREVKDLVHPKSRGKNRDLVTDRPGRARAGGNGRVGAMSPHTEPKTVEAERFAGEAADALREGLEKRQFEQLALVAPARFLGRLRGKLGVRVSRRVVAAVPKELTMAPPRDLPARLAGVFDAAERAGVGG